MDSDRLTCREVIDLVTDYFEGVLSISDRIRFEEHVMSCPPCRVYLEQMQETIRLLGRIPEESVSPDAEKALVAAFRGWKRS